MAVAAQHRKPGDNYLRRLVVRITSMSRIARLKRQFTEVDRRVHDLPRAYHDQFVELIGRECDEAARFDDVDRDRHDDLDAALARARSDNVQVRLRGLARWVALVYRETSSGDSTDAAELHRQVLRIMRELKVFSSRLPTGGSRA